MNISTPRSQEESGSRPSFLSLARTTLASIPPYLWIFIAILFSFIIMAIFAPLFAPNDPTTQNLLGRMKAPGSVIRGVSYIFGSDELGRDVLSRIIYGARASMSVAVLSVCLSGVIGILAGLLAAYCRGWVESAVMRLVDMMLSIPALLFAVITVAVLGPGFINVVLVLGLTRWTRYARVVYGQALGLMPQPYVRYARFVGTPALSIMCRHLLPNVFGQVVVVATLEFGSMVLFEAGLSFLGLGVQPPTPSWGAMMNVGRHYLDTAWWIAGFPGLCLFLLVLSVNIIGDHLRDRLDPRLR